ncbi:hypothetical protein [Actinoplanes awajinensis]|uniref:Uncharacterized protein n=1 Tax=Actinoplanes awajinensis subsp. mycoplanecinus TaxID=135947 RepID=A0A117MPM0_9ACTN|nr:hypothetical protein [Actinoplanes awajinensis]KUL28824.1 hypothetical protein ADL15_30455 [Actinoplanes awajinensis subsp. mycoplanecinus]
MSVEEDLRTTLRDRADQAAPLPDLWAGVTAGVRRDQRKRRTLAAVAAAAVVAAGITVPTLLHDRGTDRLPAAPPTASPATFPAPVFPLRPTWLPAGVPTAFASTWTITQMGPNVRMEYTEGTTVLGIEIGPLQADWETEATDIHQADVLSRPAEVHVAPGYDGSGAGERFVGVRWKMPATRWVSVLSWGKLTEADVLRVARNLAGDRIVSGYPAPFSFPFSPPGLVLQHQSDGMMCLAPVTVQQRQPAGLCASLSVGEPFDPGSASESWSVDGRRVAYEPDSASLVIEWGGDTQISVNWNPDEIPLSHDQVVTLAAGLRPIHR